MGIAEVSKDNFGLMFQLGDMGTFIIPIDPTFTEIDTPYKEMSRVYNDSYSDNINLVNYFVDHEMEGTVYIDHLSESGTSAYGVDNPEDLFYTIIENSALFRQISKDLLKEYRKYTH